jgi:glutathione S-transferase
MSSAGLALADAMRSNAAGKGANMQLIGMLDSPFVRRVAIALLVAKVPFRHRPISLFRHIDQFTALSPLLKAPSLVLDDGTVIVESNVILEYLGAIHPAIDALSIARSDAPLKAAWATGVAMTVAEKAVQAHYERALRSPEQRNDEWMERVGRQLRAGLASLEADVPETGWIGGERLGVADIAVACAWGFVQTTISDLVELADFRLYPRLSDFCARAEQLRAFRMAPPIDGVTAPVG